MKINIDNLFVELPIDFKEALKTIEINGLGIIFFIDSNKKLIGSFSDGDSRRVILKETSLPKMIEKNSDFYNKKPHYLPFDCQISEIWTLFHHNIKCVPLVDNDMNVVDFSTSSRVRKFPILQPDIGDEEINNLLECANTGWISSQGRFIKEFEVDFSGYLNGGHAVAVSSGTAALQLGMLALDIGANDEVIVPNFTFGASINAIIHVGAIPVLVDVDPETWTLSLKAIEAAINKNTKAIMPVHLYGQSAHIDEINKIAKNNNLHIVEDCAEALGGTYKKRLIGRDGDATCFSFFANKLITTGEGGMVVFKDKKTADKAKIMRDHGMSPQKKYWHEFAGVNFRMTNMQASIGVAQLKKINHFLLKRKNVFQRYDKHFKSNSQLLLLPKNSWSENSYWLYTLVVSEFTEKKRDKLLKALSDRGIDARPGFYPLHKMPPYQKYSNGSDYPISSFLGTSTINLPSSPGLTYDEIDHIAQIVINELERFK
ncbi:aminotransferase class I/II-fold pyridoxal phosphate-dependent enzyme [Nitrosomonadales bacterium]|nr:aminotransferase class I/II-fold pyridoxal phosphate-dependent enzyme [Nitrosomonadales bacterium]